MECKHTKTYPGMDCGCDHNNPWWWKFVSNWKKKNEKLIQKTKWNIEALYQYNVEVNKAREDNMRLEENEIDNVE